MRADVIRPSQALQARKRVRQKIRIDGNRGLKMDGCLPGPARERIADVSAWPLQTWIAAAVRSEARQDLAAASAAYHGALRIDPIGRDALLGLARISARAMDHDTAIEWSRRALDVRPDDADCALQLAGHMEAARDLDAALTVLDGLPVDARVCEARGNCLVLKGLDDGMDWLRRGVALAPGSCQVRTSLAIGLWRCHERATALGELERALALEPDNIRTRFVLSHLYLELGDFRNGYADTKAVDVVYPPAIRGRRWRGESVADKTLLLYDQHGHGDTLQMVRYAEVCAKLGARIILKARSTLLPLLESARGIAEWHTMSEPLPGFDYQARLLDLPGVLRDTAETIPRSVPYLTACAERTRRVRHYLANVPRPWVAVAWRGNPRQKDGLIRSCTVHDLEPLARRGYSLISLQLDATAAEIEWLGAHVLPDMDRDGAFVDSAAAIVAADAVVTVDTSIAHLAGALGAQTNMLVPYWGDWRWMADRSDTPWYPSMRLFRQSHPHDWAPAVASLAAALERSRTYQKEIA